MRGGQWRLETLAVKSYDLLKREGNRGKVWRPDWIGRRRPSLKLESLGRGGLGLLAAGKCLMGGFYSLAKGYRAETCLMNSTVIPGYKV